GWGGGGAGGKWVGWDGRGGKGGLAVTDPGFVDPRGGGRFARQGSRDLERPRLGLRRREVERRIGASSFEGSGTCARAGASNKLSAMGSAHSGNIRLGCIVRGPRVRLLAPIEHDPLAFCVPNRRMAAARTHKPCVRRDG